jgi:hypothetical protein
MPSGSNRYFKRSAFVFAEPHTLSISIFIELNTRGFERSSDHIKGRPAGIARSTWCGGFSLLEYAGGRL